MGRMLRAASRYRPRVLTLAVFIVAAAIITLANLTFDEGPIGEYSGLHYRAYGWPFIWHRLILYGYEMLGGERAVGWYYSVPRLIGNLALWLVLLGALTGVCDWLVRRYRPRLRWSLRTMLVFVALVAVACGWYAKARKRAAIQEPLVAMKGGYGTPLVYVERSGPKWLDVLGLDPLRRRIVVASSWQLRATEPSDEQRFLQLAKCSDLRYLVGFQVDELTTTTAKALGQMRQLEALDIHLGRLTPELPAALSELRELRSLSIGRGFAARTQAADDDYARLADECLAAIGSMTNLELLKLWDLPVHGKSLACLTGLKKLKSLHVDFWNGDWQGSPHRMPASEDCLRAISTLSQIESLSLEDLRVSNESLTCLAELSNLKTLCLDEFVADERPALSHLPALPELEALELSDSNIDDDDLRRLAIMPRLRSLSLMQMREESLFTPAGLRGLAATELLEEVALEGENKSPEGLAALLPIKRLNRLQLGGNSSGAGNHWGSLKLDDEKKLQVSDLEGFQRVLAALRRSKPGIFVGMYNLPVFRQWGFGMRSLGAESIPARPSSWLPGGDCVWMTPKELADFENAGNRVSYGKATFPDREDNHLITVEY